MSKIMKARSGKIQSCPGRSGPCIGCSGVVFCRKSLRKQGMEELSRTVGSVLNVHGAVLFFVKD